MSISHARIAVNSTTPVAITNLSDTFTSVTVQVQNLGTGVAYLGGADVSATSYGVSIVSGGAVTVDDLPASEFMPPSKLITKETK